MNQPRIITHRNQSGSLSVRLRISALGKSIDIASGINIPPEHWDKRRQRITADNPDHKQLNDQLYNLIDRASAVLSANPYADTATLKALIAPSETVSAPKVILPSTDDFFVLYDQFCHSSAHRNNWSEGTYQRFLSLRALLVRFNPLLRLSILSASTLDAFVSFCTSLGHANTTIDKSVKLLRQFLRWASENNLYSGNLPDTYHPHLRGSHYEHKEIIYLTLDELRKLETTYLPPYLAKVRDTFVFCCYTGLRYSDAAKLSRADIGDGYIDIVTQKTSDRIRIELNAHSSAILERYKNDTYGDHALPMYSNQRSNVILKEIGELCNISAPVRIVSYSGSRRSEKVLPKWQLLSFHAARRTFVVTALQLGIPAEVIIRWTGHKNFDALKPYFAIVDSLKQSAMSRFDNI